MKLFLCLIMIVWYGQKCVAQQTINGKVQEANTNRLIPFASVNVLNTENKIITFKMTDKNGKFSIILSSVCHNCYLQINHLTYQKTELKIDLQSKDLTISLIPKSNVLQDVEVKSKPKIKRSNDTISYEVGSFAQEQDRSIGDVIKRLPGMEVTASGLIKYQDKTVSKLYIDGDDLLEDRYAIGSRTIPHKMVKDIQVLDNHQPYKVLSGKQFTDDVAINLVIKEDVKLKLTGQAKIAAGSPQIYSPELNTILFNKKVKMINALSANNTGDDLTNDLVGFNNYSLFANMNGSKINNLLSTSTIGNPSTPRKNYYFNNTALLNTNNLYNIRNNWQLKSNIQFLFDKEKRNSSANTQYLLEDGAVFYDEKNSMQSKKWMGAIRLSANKNTDQKFINNSFALEYEKKNIDALLLRDDITDINQTLNYKIKGFSNQFSYIPALKNNNIITIKGNLSYANKPQTLQLFPGVFPEILNNNIPYKSTLQYIEVPTFNVSISTGYQFTNTKIKQSYQIGFNTNRQHFSSSLSLEQKDESIASDAKKDNNLIWNRSQFIFTPEYNWNKNRLEAQLSIPIYTLFTNYNDRNQALNASKNRILFNPVLKARWLLAQEDYAQINYQYAQEMGNIENVYRGIVLQNFRALSQNSSLLSENKNHNLNITYNLVRTLKLLFANAGIGYSRSVSNTILSSVITDNSTENELIDKRNMVETWSSKIGIDKYIFALNSTLKLKGSVSYSEFTQLVNNNLIPMESLNYLVQSNLEAKLFNRYNISYTGLFNWNQNQQKNNAVKSYIKTNSLTHIIAFPIYPMKKLLTNISIRNFAAFQTNMKSTSYTFLDLFARYHLNKWNTDFELEMNNLANIKNYKTYLMTSNRISQNQFELRGRTILLRAVFNL